MVTSFRRQKKFEPLKTPARGKVENNYDPNTSTFEDVYNTNSVPPSVNLNNLLSNTAPELTLETEDEDESEVGIAKIRNEESVLLRSMFKKRRNHVIGPKDNITTITTTNTTNNWNVMISPDMNTSTKNVNSTTAILRPPSSPEYATCQYMKNPDQCWDRRPNDEASPLSDINRSWDFSKASFDMDNRCWAWETPKSKVMSTPCTLKIQQRNKSASSKHPRSLSPEECLSDLLEFETQVESLNEIAERYQRKEGIAEKNGEWAVKVTVSTDACESKSAVGSIETKDKTMMDIGMELQYKTPSKTTKKQTTVVLPSHDQIYCEILTTSPTNEQGSDSSQHSFSIRNKNEESSFEPFVQTEKDIEFFHSSTDSKIFSSNLDEFSPFRVDGLVTTESIPEASDSFGFQPKQLCFTPRKENADKVLKALKKMKGKDIGSQQKMGNLIRKVVSEQSNTCKSQPLFNEKKFKDNTSFNENGMQTKDADLVIGKESQNYPDDECFIDVDNALTSTPKMKSHEMDGSKLGYGDGTHLDDKPSASNAALKKDGTALNLQLGMDHKPSVSNCALRKDETKLDVESQIFESPSAAHPSKRIAKVLDFESVLLTETMDVIKSIESLVRNVKPENESSEDIKSRDNGYGFNEVLKSMVRDIVLGHSENGSSNAETMPLDSSEIDQNQIETFQSKGNEIEMLNAENTSHNSPEEESEIEDISKAERTRGNSLDIEHDSQKSGECFVSKKVIRNEFNPALSPNDISCFPEEDKTEQLHIKIGDKTSDEMVISCDEVTQQENMINESSTGTNEKPYNAEAEECMETYDPMQEKTLRVSKYSPPKGLPSISQRIAALHMTQK